MEEAPQRCPNQWTHDVCPEARTRARNRRMTPAEPQRDKPWPKVARRIPASLYMARSVDLSWRGRDGGGRRTARYLCQGGVAAQVDRNQRADEKGREQVAVPNFVVLLLGDRKDGGTQHEGSPCLREHALPAVDHIIGQEQPLVLLVGEEGLLGQARVGKVLSKRLGAQHTRSAATLDLVHVLKVAYGIAAPSAAGQPHSRAGPAAVSERTAAQRGCALTHLLVYAVVHHGSKDRS
eukprot:scaffold3165_cov380-Prasinococcus_capsulatus_cf.AAC.10